MPTNLCITCGFFIAIMAKLSSKRDHVVHKSDIFTIWCFTEKNFPDLETAVLWDKLCRNSKL